jgi:hypothetical protein
MATLLIDNPQNSWQNGRVRWSYLSQRPLIGTFFKAPSIGHPMGHLKRNKAQRQGKEPRLRLLEISAQSA